MHSPSVGFLSFFCNLNILYSTFSHLDFCHLISCHFVSALICYISNLVFLLTRSHVPAGVRHDPDRRQDVEPVFARRLRLSDVEGDADEEDGVGEGRVDATVQRSAPLFREPRNFGWRPNFINEKFSK